MKVTLQNAEILEAITLYLNNNGMKGKTFTFTENENYDIEVNVDGSEAPVERKTRKPRKTKAMVAPKEEKPVEKPVEAPVEAKTETPATDVLAEMEGKAPPKKKTARVFGNVSNG